MHFRVTLSDAASPRVLATHRQMQSQSGERPAKKVTSNTEPLVRYEILVEGVLDDHWSAWFDGLHLSSDAHIGTTTIAGPLPDQTALHGLLTKIRDLGLPLLEVRCIGADRHPDTDA